MLLQREECGQHVHEACAFEGLDPDSGQWACEQHMPQFGARTGRRASAGSRKRRKGPIEATFLSPQFLGTSAMPDPADTSSDPLHSHPEDGAPKAKKGRTSGRARGRGQKIAPMEATQGPPLSLDGLAAEANGLALRDNASLGDDAHEDSPMLDPSHDGSLGAATPAKDEPESHEGGRDAPKVTSQGRRGARRTGRI